MEASDLRLAVRSLGQGCQTFVDLGVDPADEERSHALESAQVMAFGRTLLETRHKGIEDGAIAIDREDQRDVDADAVGDARCNLRQG